METSFITLGSYILGAIIALALIVKMFFRLKEKPPILGIALGVLLILAPHAEKIVIDIKNQQIVYERLGNLNDTITDLKNRNEQLNQEINNLSEELETLLAQLEETQITPELDNEFRSFTQRFNAVQGQSLDIQRDLNNAAIESQNIQQKLIKERRESLNVKTESLLYNKIMKVYC